MEHLLRPIYQKHTDDANTISVLLIEQTKPISPITDNFDVILLVVVRESDRDWEVKHYEYAGEMVAKHIVTKHLLMKWIETSGYRIAVEWVIYGKVIFDSNEFIVQLKEKLRDFPQEQRELRTVIEFGKLVKSYNEVKDLYESAQYKDAYSRMVHSLHYLARLAVIQKGYHPEVTVWNQVKKIDPEIFKLYDELIQSNEEIEKRVQLMILAVDFAISTRAKLSAKHLLDVIEKGGDGWTYDELKQHPLVAPYTLDLAAMMMYLVEKGIIQTERLRTNITDVYQRKYKVNNG